MRIFAGAVGDEHVEPDIAQNGCDDETEGGRFELGTIDGDAAVQRRKNTVRVSATAERIDERADSDAERDGVAPAPPSRTVHGERRSARISK